MDSMSRERHTTVLKLCATESAAQMEGTDEGLPAFLPFGMSGHRGYAVKYGQRASHLTSTERTGRRFTGSQASASRMALDESTPHLPVQWAVWSLPGFWGA